MKRSPLRTRPRTDHTDEAGYREWKSPVLGRCQVCGVRDLLFRHHVLLEQHVRRIAPECAWDQRNALLIGCGQRCACHRQHHHSVRRLALELVPAEAFVFAVWLLGAEGAVAYLSRYYR